MKKIRITVMRMACYKDLMEEYENPMEHACDMHVGQVLTCMWDRYSLPTDGRNPKDSAKAPGRVCLPL